jgi:hypothetical protein
MANIGRCWSLLVVVAVAESLVHERLPVVFGCSHGH